MSTSAAMAAIATSQAAMASSMARQTHIDRCKATMPNFNAQNSTVSEMREYAGCVDVVYPNEMSPDGVVLLKILFVIAFVSLVVGIIRSWMSHPYEGLENHLMVGFCCFFLVPAAVVFVCGLLYGIVWVFA